MKQLTALLLLILLIPLVSAKPKRKVRLNCAQAICTESEMRRLVKLGAIPPRRPYKPCPKEVCEHNDRLPTNGCGCP